MKMDDFLNSAAFVSTAVRPVRRWWDVGENRISKMLYFPATIAVIPANGSLSVVVLLKNPTQNSDHHAAGSIATYLANEYESP